jgi:hypothetical protein
MANYTPEFYKRVGTSVSIDLGSLSELKTVREGVTALGTQLTTTSAQVDSIDTQLGALDTQLGGVGADIGTLSQQSQVHTKHVLDRVDGLSVAAVARFDKLDRQQQELKTQVEAEAALAQTRHDAVLDVLNRLLTGGVNQPPDINDQSSEAVAAINDLQSAVLHHAPAVDLNRAKRNAEKALKPVPALLAQYLQAINGYQGGTLADRSRTYWALQRLAEDVAHHWTAPVPAAAHAVALDPSNATATV